MVKFPNSSKQLMLHSPKALIRVLPTLFFYFELVNPFLIQNIFDVLAGIMLHEFTS